MDETETADPGVYIFYSADEQLMSSTQALNISSIAAQTDGTIEQITSTAGSNFGTSLAAGDINGDGIDDLVVGSPGYDSSSTATDVGRARLFLGSDANRLVSNASNSDTEDNERDASLQGQAKDSLAGSSVHIDDLDQDGIDDLLIGAPVYNSNRGKMYILYGKSSFVGGALSSSTIVNASLTGSSSSDNLGSDIDTGDFDNDGNIDIIYGGQASSTISGTGIRYG